MKRAWKKSWLCASALATLGLARVPVLPAALQLKTPKHPNELTLARLRPGKDTLASAKKLYREKYRRVSPDHGSTWTWEDQCGNRTLRIEADAKGVIQTITVTSEDRSGNCQNTPAHSPPSSQWKTGRGLAPGSLCSHAIALYGQPNSAVCKIFC